MVDEACRVPEVNVLVNQTMHQQQRPPQFVNVRHHGAPRIPVRVLLWCSHVPLRVVRVVPVPVRHRRPRNPNLERLGSAAESHGRHVTAVTPAVDGDAGGVCDAVGDRPFHAGLLVLHLQVTHVPLDLRLEPQPPPAAPAVVNLDDEVALGAEELRAEVCRQRPAVGHRLHVRPPVHRHHRRVRPGPELARVRFQHRRLEGDFAILGRERVELRVLQVRLEPLVPAVVVRVQLPHNRPVRKLANVHPEGMLRGAVLVDKELTTVVDDHVVHPALSRHLHDVAALHRHRVQVPVQPPALGSCEVDQTPRLVHSLHLLHHPITVCQLPHELAVVVVHVKVLEPCALGSPDEVLRALERSEEVVQVDPVLRLLHKQRLRLSCGREQPQQLQLCLLAILHLDDEGVIWQPLDPREIRILPVPGRQVKPLQPAPLRLHHPELHHRVLLACKRVVVLLLCALPDPVAPEVHDAVRRHHPLVNLLERAQRAVG
mmetsp:Transcript_12167/g.25037  ORF Transcript_12167/g.25037 Transcript_12167/m.25037 type:complete len:486 (-) Transcript_12167:1012-2469(-)